MALVYFFCIIEVYASKIMALVGVELETRRADHNGASRR